LLIAGQLPEEGHIFSKEARHFATLQKFNLLQHQLNARPKVHNHYFREAWASPHDNALRVTVDRRVQIEPYFMANAVTQTTKPTRVFPGIVILELKFGLRFPDWMRELVRRFNLMQFSASKYSEGILLMGEHRFHNGDFAFDWEGWTPREREHWGSLGQRKFHGKELPETSIL
jgi:hypothetical protein